MAEGAVGEESVVVNGLAQDAEGGSGEALVGLDWTPWATMSHRRLLNMGVTQAG